MKKLLLLSLILLAGCQSVPVTAKFPTVPEQLLVECGELNTIDKEVVYLSEFTKTVVENYQKYHKCSGLVEAWKQWYNEQKTIFESATKK